MATQQKKYLNQEGLAYFFTRLKEIFAAREEGKGLSTNDFTDALKERLEELDPEEIIVDADAMTDTQIDEIIASADAQPGE